MSMTAFNRDKLKKILQNRIVKAYEDRVIKTKDIYRHTLDPFSAVLDAKLLNKDIQSWIDNLTTTKDVQEIDRSYNIIRNYIYSKSLANDNIEYSKLLSIIEKYKSNIPLPVNIDNNSQYDISVGFTNNKTV